MPVYSWDDDRLLLHVKVNVGNGHMGGIDVRDGGTSLGTGNDELRLDLGPSGPNSGRTLVFTASMRRGRQEPPPPALLTLNVFQTDPGAGAQAPPQNLVPLANENPLPFDANGLCVVTLALSFI
jgi:hypothetical protein